MQLDRQDLIDGLREIVLRAHAEGVLGVSIKIVGGAALRLAYFDRETTADIDAQIAPLDSIATIVRSIALDRGWPSDWLNDQAAMFIPTLGRSVDWESLLDDPNVSIAVAPIDALLAMKLHAARPGRDIDDIANLLAINEIDTVEAAEELYESFYPGDALPNRTIRTLERMLEIGLPPRPTAPPHPRLS
jgi:Nucleotidyltransferase of unknown function (DUF6036)